MPEFSREMVLGKDDAAEFLRDLADGIEDEEPVALEGDDWSLFQPYENKIPFRITQGDEGMELDLKLLSPD